MGGKHILLTTLWTSLADNRAEIMANYYRTTSQHISVGSIRALLSRTAQNICSDPLLVEVN